ncbi:MAG: hypothetical protein Ct9H300mP14_10180 [Gammaproteobacteria bacterium]|nr:MAG: hypothetical protein Ct9H300mP14_10180 [Gammaproteobacteria bacterium]
MGMTKGFTACGSAITRCERGLSGTTTGTAHAVLQALPTVNPESDVLVLYGDVPLIKQSTLASLVAAVAGRNLVVLTAKYRTPAVMAVWSGGATVPSRASWRSEMPTKMKKQSAKSTQGLSLRPRQF